MRRLAILFCSLAIAGTPLCAASVSQVYSSGTVPAAVVEASRYAPKSSFVERVVDRVQFLRAAAVASSATAAQTPGGQKVMTASFGPAGSPASSEAKLLAVFGMALIGIGFLRRRA